MLPPHCAPQRIMRRTNEHKILWRYLAKKILLKIIEYAITLSNRTGHFYQIKAGDTDWVFAVVLSDGKNPSGPPSTGRNC